MKKKTGVFPSYKVSLHNFYCIGTRHSSPILEVLWQRLRPAADSRFYLAPLKFTANVATLMVAVLLSLVLVKNYLLPTSTSVPPRSTDFVAVGANLSKRLPDVNWSGNGRTLILALSTHCHFCTESAPFFREIRKSVGNNVKLVGVLPEPVTEAQVYLNREGVDLDEVKQIPLYKLGVQGTPTMLLVNKDGIVMQTWVGRLAPDKQDQALKVIGTVEVQKRGA